MAANKHLWLGFRVLCLLSGSGWVLDAWRPEVLPGLVRTAVHLGVLSLLCWAASLARREAPVRRSTLGPVALWGAALLAVPQVVVAGAAGHVSDLSEVLVFGLVPVVVVFAVAQGTAGFGLVESPLRSLAPALVGLAGLAVLVPFALPGSASGVSWFFAFVSAAALSGVAAVRLHGSLKQCGVIQGAAVVAGAAAMLAAGFSWLGSSALTDWSAGMVATEAARCLLVDGPVLLLTVWQLREMPPVRFAARYLVIPLVTIVEGFLLVRPQWSWTVGAGFLLLAGGCAGLLRADSEEVHAEL